MKSDLQLHTDVVAELTWDPRVSEKEIAVAAKDGVVTLMGSVGSYPQKWAAERAAERVAGVRAVANELTVTLANPSVRTDNELAHHVVEALVRDFEVPDSKITAAVTNAWVTLDGEVEWQYQRDAAERAVRNITGIRGVTTNVKVTPSGVSTYDVRRSIKQALERRADRIADRIAVDAVNDVVTLSGAVPSFGDRRAAEGAAWAAPGVKEVHDLLEVTP
jgi:osmotically-inducible protein OsmY